jgi:hypothetical protein
VLAFVFSRLLVWGVEAGKGRGLMASKARKSAPTLTRFDLPTWLVRKPFLRLPLFRKLAIGYSVLIFRNQATSFSPGWVCPVADLRAFDAMRP